MMAIKSGYVYLKGVSFHAFHGVLPQESLVGADYVLDLRVGYPIEQAMESDNVEATLNYAVLYELAQQEMQKPSRLLEHVAGRIVKAIQERFPEVTSIDITLMKKNPPMGADCDGAGIEIHI